MTKLNVKKNDTVLVLSGKDRGKKGKIIEAVPSANKVIVEGVNLAVYHTKPKKQGQKGGRITREAAIHASNVMTICSKCSKATRIAHKISDDGKKIRICKKCGASLDS